LAILDPFNPGTVDGFVDRHLFLNSCEEVTRVFDVCPRRLLSAFRGPSVFFVRSALTLEAIRSELLLELRNALLFEALRSALLLIALKLLKLCRRFGRRHCC
jgi:hypothetical protein